MTTPGEEGRAVDDAAGVVESLRQIDSLFHGEAMRVGHVAATLIESLRARAERAENRIEHEVRLRQKWEQIAKDETATRESAERERDAANEYAERCTAENTRLERERDALVKEVASLREQLDDVLVQAKDDAERLQP